MFDAYEAGGAVAVLYALDDGGVPTEVMLFGPGRTDTVKGQFLLDDRAAADVMSAYEDLGHDRLPFDIAHGMLSGTSPDMHKAAGWFRPEVREGALYAADIEWTDYGRAALAAREFRFFSPAIHYDEKTRRIKRLINVALTNIPATKNQQPLVLDAAESEQMSEVILSAIGEADEAAAVVRVKALSDFESAAAAACACEPAEVLSAIESLKEAAAAAVAELNQHKADEAARVRAARIAALSDAGKVPPALREVVESFTDEQLDKLEAAPAVLSAPIEEPAGSGKVENLSAEELAACKALGLSEEAFRATKES